MPLLVLPGPSLPTPRTMYQRSTAWQVYSCLLKQFMWETEATVFLIVALPMHSKYSENVNWVNESIKYETCSFFLKPVMISTIELGRTITFCSLLHCPVVVFILAIFWSGLWCHLSPINDKYCKAGGDVRYHVLYKSLCNIKFPVTCSPASDCSSGWVSQQIRRERGHWPFSNKIGAIVWMFVFPKIHMLKF